MGVSATTPSHPVQAPRRRRGVIAVDLTLFAVLAGLLVLSFDLAPDARRFPLLSLSVTLVLIAIDLLLELVPRLRQRLGFLEQGFIDAPQPPSTDEQTGAQPASGRLRRISEIEAFSWVAAFGVAMYVFNYLAAMAVFLAIFSFRARVPVRVWIPTTLVLLVISYVIFYEYMRLR